MEFLIENNKQAFLFIRVQHKNRLLLTDNFYFNKKYTEGAKIMQFREWCLFYSFSWKSKKEIYQLKDDFGCSYQKCTYTALQAIKMKLSCVWAERAVSGSAKTALKFKYEI